MAQSINKKRCLICRKTFIPTKELKKFCSVDCRLKRKKEKVKKSVQRFRKNEGAKKENQAQKKTEQKFNEMEQMIDDAATQTDDLQAEILKFRDQNLENEQIYGYVGETMIKGVEIHDPDFETKIKDLINE